MSGSRPRDLKGLSPEQLGFLARRLRAGKPAAPERISRRPGEGADAPLSFAQQRLWFLDQLEPGNPAYNVASAVDLAGALDAAALERSLREVVRRHEALRTCFVLRDGQPVQRLAAEPVFDLPRVDLSALPPESRERLADALAVEAGRQSFDLGRLPLLAALLLRLEPGRHRLVLVMHHIVSDGWSTGVLTREMAVLYRQLTAGEPAALPPLPIQYADYAVWQHARLESGALDGPLEAARRDLAGVPVLELPADRPRPAVKSYRGGRVPLRLDAATVTAARALAEREGTSLFAFLTAAFAALLHRVTQQSDLSIGAPWANRTRVEVEGLIGFFVNSLALRLDLSADPAFADLVRGAGALTVAAHERQEIPFERLVEVLQPERGLAQNPLFQVMLALQSAPFRLELPGLDLRLVEVDNRTSKLDLLLALAEEDGALAGSFEYSADLFDRPFPMRLARGFAQLLTDALAAPERPVSALALLAPEERQQVVVEWNDTAAEAEPPVCLHDLVAEQAARTPDAVALVDRGTSTTYRELWRAASALARRLRALGVGPEVRVGVCLDRGRDLIVSLLGVLESGGAYVPLDPAYPAERLAFMLEDSRAPLVLTRPQWEDRLAESPARRLLLGGPELTAAPGAGPWPREVVPGNLAYLIYTSGSTGRPKGVAIEHRSAVTFLRWARLAFTGDEMERTLAATSVCFDLSVFEIFAPLSRGGAVVVAENALALPESGVVTLLNTVPSAAAELLALNGIPPSVRTVCLAGEPLPGSLVRQLYALGTVRRVLNLYGPSEDTTYSTGAVVPPGTAMPTIGRPLAATRAYAVDRGLRPVPLGAVGELLLGSDSLARGYLDRPELTAERFLPDPFSGAPGSRLYRTGDLVRHLPEGELAFLGRIDHQVKVRGFRVELGEIEAALLAHPGVRQTVVAARPAAGGLRLVAWVVASEGADLDAGALRDHVRRQLPEHMVPAAIVLLPALPLLPNGKVDRKALPDPAVPAATPGDETPRGATEELLATLWAGLLGVPRVGRTDDFFALGGHSLLAARAAAHIREAFRVDLPVRALFETPTVAALAAVLDASALGEASAAIPRAPRHAPLPLSFAQERLWFLHQLDPEDAAYHMPVAYRLRGPLDGALLAAALGVVVRRHEALRTHYVVGPEGVRQWAELAPGEAVEMPRVDLRALPAPRRELEARRLVQLWSRRPFDLAQGPVLRALLAELTDDDRVLSLVLHHIAADGWSLALLAGELSAACAALVEGRPPALPALPIQPADHAVWERGWLQGEVLKRELAYWRERLGDLPEPLELPADRPRGLRRSDLGGQVEAWIPPAVHARLAALGRAERATLFMVLLATFQALLARVARRDDVTVGAPVARRGRPELERLIGCFLNLLPLRSAPGRCASFRDLLAAVRDGVLGATAHQDVPFEMLVAELQPERSLHHDPIFQVLFVLQNGPAPSLDLPGVAAERLATEAVGSRLDLSLAVEEVPGGGLRTWWEYRSSLFDAPTIQRLAQCFSRLVEAIAGAADLAALAPADLPLLAEAERHQLLAEWNDTGAARGAGLCLHDLVARQALRTPHAPALDFGGAVLTYAELERRANGVAWQLRSLGAGPEVRVGLFIERSLEMVVGLLGVLKAGAAYVPLEPGLPAERLSFLLGDAAVSAVVTLERLLPRLPVVATSLPVLTLEGQEVAEAEAPPLSGVTADHLAYVLYTSGSTGRPKGVMNAHGPVVHRIEWVRDLLPVGPGDRWLQKTPLGFDVSVGEIFGPLAAGACLVIARPGGHEDPDYLVRTIAEQGITVAHFVPAMLQGFLETPGAERCTGLRRLLCSGEALAPELARRASDLLRTDVVNLYGPTEAAIEVSAWTWEPGGDRREVPIGRPAPGNRLYVLEAVDRPAPFGVPGELCIAGVQVARGYWNRPDLTAERFVPDPFAGVPGARMYRTGDLVRSLVSGEIVFLGRLDHQVKIRGLRIELGEIEAALLAQTGVRQAVVVVGHGATGARLIAYLTLAEPGEAALPRLRRRLAELLPEYMVPAVFVPLDALPLTASGKVDRRALPAPVAPESAEGTEPPRGAAEELLAEIFADLLGRPRIGRQDDFFAAGGHSLLAARLLSRVRNAFRAELPLRAVFEAPTVAALAQRLTAAERTIDDPIPPRPRDGGLPLSVAQERIWFLERVGGAGGAYHIPFGVRLEGRLDGSALRDALSGVVARHEVLRTVYLEIAGRTAQVVHAPEPFVLPVIDLRALPPATRERAAGEAAAQEPLRPFDLERGPMLRGLLLWSGNEEHRLLLDVHHIAADGWSVEILIREIAALYAGRGTSLPALPVQYADYATWQREWLARGDALRQLAWWRERLAGAPPALDLPVDRPRSEERGFRGGRVSRVLTPDLADSLRALGRRLGATSFMTLLAGFQLLLGRLSGQRDLVVGTPMAARSRSELEPLVGVFLNTLALRGDLAGDPSFAELVGRVREAALGAFAHQDLPFERLLAELRPERRPGRAPLFQVFFNVLGFSREIPPVPGLTVIPDAPPEVPAKLDLTLYVSDPEREIRFDLVYDAALFARERAAEMLEQLAHLLAQAAAAPERPLSAFDLITPTAAAVLPDPTVPLGSAGGSEWDGPVHERLALWARRDPERPVLRGPGGIWSRGQLAAASAGLADALRRDGLGAGDVVAVWAGREPALVVALLGVMAAGAAFCILDPAHPPRRLAACVRVARPRGWLLATGLPVPEEVEEALAEVGTGVRRAVSSEETEAPESAADAFPAGEIGPRDLAYLAFTSGTTGEPKGILGEHGPLSHFLTWHAGTFGLGEEDRFSLLSGLAHDPLLRDLFTPLWVGGVLCLPEVPDLRVSGDLAGWLRREQVTVAHLTPALAQTLGSEMPSLRLVCFGGDALVWQDVRRLRELAPAARCVGFYGATETPQAMGWAEAAGSGEGRVPVGRGIDQVQLLVVGEAGGRAGIGEIGEILVRTPHLARGYLNDPERTRERFPANPFAASSSVADPRDRVYRTGDLGRYLPDGQVEFVGRADRQVKIRGYRVEPAEIESILEEHPAVREAVVIARERTPGDLYLVAYAVPAPGAAPGDLRAWLAERLPAWAVPVAVMTLATLPLTANGKLAVAELPEPRAAERPEALVSAAEQRIAEIWREVLGVESVGRHESFFDLGGHSLHLVEVHRRLRALGGAEIPLMDLFRYPTIAALARHLEPGGAPAPAAVPQAAPSRRAGEAVAIVGMAGRFPSARDLAELWRNLESGTECITFFSADELRGVENAALLADPAYVRAKGVLEDAELFDRGLFGYGARESELLDPQQRVFLECAWEALESAGYTPASFAGKIGVFAGSSLNTYLLSLCAQPERLAALGGYQAFLMGDKDHLATRVSYKLGLTGPSLTVQTTCSTSLVAVHLACRSLLEGECDMAMAGGVSITFPLKIGYLWEEGGIGSPDGHCRPFDARAAGTIGGNGAGVVVLKRLSDAFAGGDRICAVIRGSAINNDGARKVGYTAPSIEGQAQVIRAALDAAGVPPETISYVEAHGTGTTLGDPIEVAALQEAFAGAAGRSRCALGSVKSSIGHLSAAAGVAGLLKTVLALQNRRIPPSPWFESPNPQIDFERGPFFVNREPLDWPAGEVPRRAGVSSFGFGGTNAHVILEEAPAAAASVEGRPWQLVVLSARSPQALETYLERFAGQLDEPQTDLRDLAYTLQVGRQGFAYRLALTATDAADAAEALRETGRPRVRLEQTYDGERPVVFLFPGQGAQRLGMGEGLYRSEPLFREVVDHCAERLEPVLGVDLRTVLWPAERSEEATVRLRQTAMAQPALFVLEYALARLWISWGVRPQAMLGHSLGEYVAACLAGVFSLEDALALVAARAAHMQAQPVGAMLGVPLPEAELAPRLSASLALAAVNGPGLCVVSGPLEAVDALERELAAEGLSCSRLHTSHAFHSPLMEEAARAVREIVGRLTLRAPEIPVLSNLTGTWLRAGQATDPEYWAEHLRRTVRFSDGLAELLREPAVLLEVGPGTSLTTLARRHPGHSSLQALVSSLPEPGEAGRDGEVRQILDAVGRLWTAGTAVSWADLHRSHGRRRAAAPTYPFERRRYSVLDAAAPVAQPVLASSARDLADWFHAPSWKPAPLPAGEEGISYPCLLLTGRGGFGSALAERLRHGGPVIEVRPGEHFASNGDHAYTIDPREPADYSVLLDELRRLGHAPHTIVHLWALEGELGGGEPETPEETLERSFYSLLHLGRALGQDEAGHRRLMVVSSGAQSVGAEALRRPLAATLLGPCRVLPLEVPGLRVRAVDLDLPGTGPQERRIELLAAELGAPAAGLLDALVAYRGGRRWVQGYEPVRLEQGGTPRLRHRGVYLITGGFGGVGLQLAGHMARTCRASIALVGRMALPERAAWEEWLAAHGADDPVSRRILAVRELEAEGASVLPVKGDVTDPADMWAALQLVRERFGGVHGVIHAAGVAGGGLTFRRTAAEAAAVLAPKVRGALVLEELFAGEDLDFLLLCSSRIAALARPGQIDYCAANVFLDALAVRAAAEGRPVVSIGWEGWKGTGMAAETQGGMEEGIGAAEGLEIFTRVLGSGLPHVVVSRQPLRDLLARVEDLTAAALAEGMARSTTAAIRHPRPALRTAFVSPSTPAERELAGLWEELLGVEPVGVLDDFFELGGDSVIGLQMAARARQRGFALTPRDLFSHPTLAELARALETAGTEEDGSLDPMEAEPAAPRNGASGYAPQDFPQADLSQDELNDILASLEVPEGLG